MNTQLDLFDGAPILDSYSRAQAIEDGVLVDVSTVAAEAGIRFPVALTRAVWDRYVKVPKGVILQDEAGRLWDILWMFRCSAKSAPENRSCILFRLHIRNDNRERTPPLRTLKAVVHPGDDEDPVLTISLPEED
jgi:hypothetical protein